MSVKSLCTLFMLLSSASFASVTVQDSLGEHTFEQTPERVVVLNWDLIEQVVELEVRPVGAPELESYSEWVVQPPVPSGVVDIGTRAEPNLEKIAALKPDVILAALPQKDLIPALQDIAPVLYFENHQANTDDGEVAITQFHNLAKLLDKEAVAKEKLEDLHHTLETLKSSLKAAFGDDLPPVLPLRFSSENAVFLYTQHSTSDWALRHLGLHSALTYPPAPWGVTQKRLDVLQSVTEGYVLHIQPFPYQDRLDNSYIWQAMPFVRHQRINQVKPVWNYGGAMSLKYIATAYAESLLELAE